MTKMYVYLAITDLKVHPDEITSLTKVNPTKVDLKGDFIGRSKMKCKSNRWEYRVDAADKFELEFLVKKLLQKFRNVGKLKKAIKLGNGHINCVFSSTDRTPTIELSAKTMAKIAELNCSFWVDYYT